MILKIVYDMQYIKDEVTLMRILSILIGKQVGGDSGSRPNSPASVDGGQASHAPPMNDQGQATRGAMDILQQIAQALQRAAQPAAVVPQRSAIERMEKYRPMDFLGKKDDEPSMAENWIERTKKCCGKCIAHQRRT